MTLREEKTAAPSHGGRSVVIILLLITFSSGAFLSATRGPLHKTAYVYQTATAYIHQTTTTTASARISVTPPAQVLGGSIVIAGIGFAPSDVVTIRLDDIWLGNRSTDAVGGFSYDATVPKTTFGNHVISGIDGMGNSAAVIFTVTIPPVG